MNKKTEAKYSWLLLSGAATALSRGLFWSVTFLTGLIAEREGCGLEEGVVGWTAHGLKSWQPGERAEDSISSQRSLGSSLILGVHWSTVWKCLELAPMLWRKKIMPFIPENQGGLSKYSSVADLAKEDSETKRIEIEVCWFTKSFQGCYSEFGMLLLWASLPNRQ